MTLPPTLLCCCGGSILYGCHPVALPLSVHLDITAATARYEYINMAIYSKWVFSGITSPVGEYELPLYSGGSTSCQYGDVFSASGTITRYIYDGGTWVYDDDGAIDSVNILVYFEYISGSYRARYIVSYHASGFPTPGAPHGFLSPCGSLTSSGLYIPYVPEDEDEYYGLEATVYP